MLWGVSETLSQGGRWRCMRMKGREKGGRTVPPINLRRPLSHFVQSPLWDKHGHDLLVDVPEEDEVHEDGEELVLESLHAVVGAEAEAEVQRLSHISIPHLLHNSA